TITRSGSARSAGASGAPRSTLGVAETLGSGFCSPHEATSIDASRRATMFAHAESVIGGAPLTPDSPLVAELAQLQEYRSRVGLIRKIGKRLAQSCDDGR